MSESNSSPDRVDLAAAIVSRGSVPDAEVRSVGDIGTSIFTSSFNTITRLKGKIPLASSLSRNLPANISLLILPLDGYGMLASPTGDIFLLEHGMALLVKGPGQFELEISSAEMDWLVGLSPLDHQHRSNLCGEIGKLHIVSTLGMTLSSFHPETPISVWSGMLHPIIAGAPMMSSVESFRPKVNTRLSLIEEATSRIWDDVAFPWSLTSLAEQANYSPFHFSRMFNSATGMALPSFINHARFRRLAFFFANIDRSVVVGAQSVGWDKMDYSRSSIRESVGFTRAEIIHFRARIQAQDS